VKNEIAGDGKLEKFDTRSLRREDDYVKKLRTEEDGAWMLDCEMCDG